VRGAEPAGTAFVESHFAYLLLVAITAKALIIQVAIREHENHCMTLLYLNLCFMLVMDDGWYELS
jgi:hypothetical protein